MGVRPRSESGITRPTPSAVGVDADPTTFRRKDVPLVDTPALKRGSSTGVKSRSGGGPLAPEGCVLKVVFRRFRNGFREGTTPKPRNKAAAPASSTAVAK